LSGLADYTRRRLEAIAGAALARAGVAGVVPTPLDAVAAVAGIAARLEMDQLPSGPDPPARPLLGALWFEERAMFVAAGQSEARRRFTEAHEVVHALCPWHHAALYRDTADELSARTRAHVEIEANYGAGALIFQADRFREQRAREPCSLATAKELAVEHGASVQAALHHHVEHHAGEVALIVTGRFPRRDGALPVWQGTESPAFRAAHGPIRAHVGGVPAGGPLRDVIEAARVGSPAASATLPVGLTGRRFRAHAHYNRHTFLVLLSPCGRRAGAAGRR
jgi:hypothetical protein